MSPSTKEVLGEAWDELLMPLNEDEKALVEKFYARLDEIHYRRPPLSDVERLKAKMLAQRELFANTDLNKESWDRVMAVMLQISQILVSKAMALSGG